MDFVTVENVAKVFLRHNVKTNFSLYNLTISNSILLIKLLLYLKKYLPPMILSLADLEGGFNGKF